MKPDQEWLKTTLESISDAVILTDIEGNIRLLSQKAELLTGWKNEEVLHKPLTEVFQLLNAATNEELGGSMLNVLETGKKVEFTKNAVLLSKSGEKRPVRSMAKPVKDEDKHIQGIVLVFKELVRKNKKLGKAEFLSFHDPLTGLYNRRFFEEEFKRLNTERNLPISLALIDIDYLDDIKKELGHTEGNLIIKKVAEIIKQECRVDDIIARISESEFMILLPKTNSKQADILVNRINDLVDKEKLGTLNLPLSSGCEPTKKKENEIALIYKKAAEKTPPLKSTAKNKPSNALIEIIMETLFHKNETEEKESAQVSKFCAEIGQILELGKKNIENLEMVGLIRDIGKVSLDSRILHKPDKLTESEMAEMKRHPELGHEILSTMNEYAHLSDYVLAHHERWDGKGYPKGLKGEEIPLEARIVAIADAYNAMSSRRPYRKAMNENTAAEEILKNAGTQFDPHLAKVFVEKVLGKKHIK
ncbi:HD domain-containing phosphohydrolase [Dehalobacter sp. TeCB1]|jgi:diguanylate cyclase (GGDEF)-like protein/PAS domain S-box-containing protein|uniref:HD domain-containing phosphohydrolase n=1 Tax=Dehalobacter sp. TeCB1 TaxID=1843715 RepID=UPI0002FD7879|nr:HD domain-containing phosphohydrolase [Dehalobacter sp. TeCB1]OCZ49418.1 diguanylate cyclase [Dehalobacter sp. TeCB1]